MANAKNNKDENEVVYLSKAEEFYLENNSDKTDIELATDINKPVAVVREHLHRTNSESRVSKLLIHTKGCTLMTGGASEAADQSRKGYVTQQAIQEAVGRGDYEEAARLKSMLNLPNDTNAEERKRQEGHIHYMKGYRKKPREVRR